MGFNGTEEPLLGAHSHRPRSPISSRSVSPCRRELSAASALQLCLGLDFCTAGPDPASEPGHAGAMSDTGYLITVLTPTQGKRLHLKSCAHSWVLHYKNVVEILENVQRKQQSS